MLKRSKIITTEVRPFVRLLADASSGYARAIVQGAMQYINAHRQWNVQTILRRNWEQTINWPKCDGAIVAGLERESFDGICAGTHHVISCTNSIQSESVSTVWVDNGSMGLEGAQHLIDLGVEHFSYYGMPGLLPSDQRAEGFASAVRNRGHSYIECPFSTSLSTHHDGTRTWLEITEWLKKLPKPIGIMTFDDAGANYLAAACGLADLDVPEQIAILGVNNDEFLCESASVPLSSVDAGYPRVGFAAARLLHRLLLGEQLCAAERDIRLPPLGVVRRQSTDLVALNDPSLVDAIRYIRENACKPCSVNDVAESAAIGRRLLERRFVQKLGRTPGEEIMRIRMETAKRLLRMGALSLSDIARICGFSADSSFVRAFHIETEITPHAYRRMAQKIDPNQS